MLKSLSVKNYILIEELVLEPDSNLIVITGETGAGKSIILGAISLLLGQRADTKTLYNPDKKCIIEGVFNIKDYQLHSLFEEKAWDYFDDCIIRREIQSGGRTRAFINDSPVNLNDLKQLIGNLIDIHSQHESIFVNNSSYQLDVIDAYAGCQNELDDFQKSFNSYNDLMIKLDDLKRRRTELQKEKDYKSFLFQELEEASLVPDEKERVEEELSVNENSEQIKIAFQEFQQLLQGNEISGLQILKEAGNIIQKLSSYSPKFEEINDRFHSAIIELNDIISDVESIADRMEIDPERLSELRERINLIQHLEAKHNTLEFNDLISIRDNLNQDLFDSGQLNSQIEELNDQKSKLYEELFAKAKTLSAKRRNISDDFSNRIMDLLRKLGIPEINFAIEFKDQDIQKSGIDKVEMKFSANKGQNLSSLKEAASGGEISRIMLALKYLIADKKALPTIIFDEIDTGISGKIAIQMGEMFREISNSHQVLAITHLPQIAAKGKMHYVVFKDTAGDKTKTSIKELSGEERIIEIAQMISGSSESNTAIESAKELLEHN